MAYSLRFKLMTLVETYNAKIEKEELSYRALLLIEELLRDQRYRLAYGQDDAIIEALHGALDRVQIETY